MIISRVAMAAVLIVLAGEGGAIAQSGGGNESKSASGAGARSAPWTTHEMSGATAAALPDVDPKAVAAVAASQRAASGGAPGTLPAADDPAGESERKVLRKPLYWAGKLFYRTPRGDFTCSAQFISPSVVLTAANCVRDPDTGAWYEDFVFALGYDRGKWIELYDYDCAATKNGWVQPGLERYLYDYAMLKVLGRSKMGHFGTHWNWAGEYREANRVGYLVGNGNAEVATVDRGRIAVSDGIVMLRHGNNRDQAGISGAAFIGGFTQNESREDGNYVISVDSFSYREEPGVNYGPYFTADFKDLFDYAERGCQ
ncbi:MAG TPA: hypothetical protein VFK86_12445 [Bauldia sp.]|nr:hypothetical protein [Bauldia sp.]